MRLFWIRHGQMQVRASDARTLDAVDRMFNQELQGPLTERGRDEARSVAAYFERHPVDHIYSSHLIRARETADVTAETLGLTVNVRPDVGELRTGYLAKGSRSRFLARCLMNAPLPSVPKRALVGGVLIPLYFRGWRHQKNEGAETPEAFNARLWRFLDELRETHPYHSKVAIFAHGYLIHNLARMASGLRVRSGYIRNGSITEMVLSADELMLLRFADADHL